MEIAGLAIAGNIDKVVLINVDPVLTRRPDATVLLAALSLQEARITWTAPGLQQFACFVEHEHRRRGHTTTVNLPIRPRESERADRLALRVGARYALHPAISGGDRTGTVVNPDVVVLIDGDSADIADHPAVVPGLQPSRIEHKSRRSSFVLNRHTLSEAIRNVGLLQSVHSARGGLQCAQRRNEARHTQRAGEHSHPNSILDNFRSHRDPPIMAMALRGVALRRGLDRDFRLDLLERHTYTPEALPSEPKCLSSPNSR